MKGAIMYVIIRTEKAGAFAGILDECQIELRTVTLLDARRLWYWDGAASLSGLAAAGTSKPQNCKFGAPVRIVLPQVIEIIEVVEAARKSIEDVQVWTA
jgi:uncharacterized protein DUF6948